MLDAMTHTIAPISASVPQASQRPTPPLAPGDRLTHEQFMARSALLPDRVKAERFQGIVYMPPPLTANFHGQPHSNWTGWLWVYGAATPGVVVADNSTTLLGNDDDAQPDVSLRILPAHGGRSKLTTAGYIEGAPELIVEITASSASYDLGAKLDAYRRAGVNEYIAHRTYDREIDWFDLIEGRYEKRAPDAEGIYRSAVFPGLWLAVEPMLNGLSANVLTTLQAGLKTAEHEAFVRRLVEAAGQK